MRTAQAEKHPSCALCGRPADSIHEMTAGPDRKFGYEEPAACLSLCYATCHTQIVQRWPIEKQLALKYRAERKSFDLEAVRQIELKHIHRPAPDKLTWADVEAQLPSVDEAMRIARSKAGTWGRS